jgi:hypothetical protein
MDLLGVLAMAAVMGIAASDWRRAVLLAVVVGFGQDVVRKLTPGEPVYLVVLFTAVFAVAAVGLLLRGGHLALGGLMRMHPDTRLPILLFIWIVVAQGVVTLASYGSAVLAGIGAMAYLLPLAALSVSLYYAGSDLAVRRLFLTYVAMSAVFSAGVYLNVLGYQSGILDSVGEGLFVYPEEGGVLKLPSGLFRSPEIAAWHGTTAIVLVGLLVIARAMPGGAAVGAVVIAFLLGAVVLTGRRKMIMELLVFVPTYLALLAYFQGRAARVIALLSLVATVVFVSQLALVPNDSRQDLRPYVSRFKTVAGEATDRLTSMTVDSVRHAYRAHGFFGSGAGIGSQGGQHFGGGARLAGYAAEGGLAKILIELGVPGVVVCLWMALALIRACLRSVRQMVALRLERRAIMATGLLAFLATNVLVFATASQVFGDPFVLFNIGMMLGVILRVPQHRSGQAVTAGLLAAAPQRRTG